MSVEEAGVQGAGVQACPERSRRGEDFGLVTNTIFLCALCAFAVRFHHVSWEVKHPRITNYVRAAFPQEILRITN